MRDIKFRGKRLNDGKWIYGVPYLGDGGWQMLIDQQTATPEEGIGSWKVDPATVGQFTGLRDKNGKEIYEGDVCKVKHGEVRTVTGVVAFEKQGFYVSQKGYLYDFTVGLAPHPPQVIGNIHDNPELLKAE